MYCWVYNLYGGNVYSLHIYIIYIYMNKDHGIWSHHFVAIRWGSNGNSDRLYFLGLQNHCRLWPQPWSHELKGHELKSWIKRLPPWKESYDQPRQHIKKQRHYFANKGLFSQSYEFSSSRIWMWELDHREGWVVKSWCFWTVVLEMTPEMESWKSN